MLYNPNWDQRVGNPLEADLDDLIGWRPSLPMGFTITLTLKIACYGEALHRAKRYQK